MRALARMGHIQPGCATVTLFVSASGEGCSNERPYDSKELGRFVLRQEFSIREVSGGVNAATKPFLARRDADEHDSVLSSSPP